MGQSAAPPDVCAGQIFGIEPGQLIAGMLSLASPASLFVEDKSKVRRFLLLVSFLCFAILASGFTVCVAQSTPDTPPYRNPTLPVEQRVQDLLGRMTLQEKVSMLSGSGWMESAAVDRLGIPSIKMADGPMGIRSWLGSSAITNSLKSAQSTTSTAFPAGVAIGATWDPELAKQEGQVIAQEMKAMGRDMILGPTVNIQRVPLWGRNFEGYGEDPYLAGQMAVGYIEGVQGEGVIATVKHFVANNQEYERHRIDAEVGERALHEIYLPAFKAAVQQAHVWSVMSAYNRVNGAYCAENIPLLKDVLQKDWGFQGFVVSDWGSTYSTAPTVNAGMDIEMPGGEAAKKWLKTPSVQASGNSDGWLTPDKVLPEVSTGKISTSTIDDNVSRILRVVFASGIFDHPHVATGLVDTPQQRAVARRAAAESIVLLKNAGNLLPLDLSKVHSIAVIGPNAAVARTGGGGSSLVHPKYAVTPLDGVKEKAGNRVQVLYALGNSMEGENPAQDTPAAQQQLRDEAVALAAKADVAILFVGYSPKFEAESFDRKTMDLPSGQDELIRAVAKANRNTIVVFNAGDPITMAKWVDGVPAIVDMWYGGQEGGHGIADVLFGDVNPSGKLPFSFLKEWKDSPAYGHYPGVDLRVDYAEGIYVGYRYFDKHKTAIQYPFGYGLSYTSFDYSDLKIAPGKFSETHPVEVALNLRNSGSRAGAEVVELYVHDGHSSVDRPVKELKGFRRVELAPGETKAIRFTLDRSAFAYYSTAKKDWVAEPGEFEILVGASSQDIKLKGNLELTK
jgi:beta-glucosidase